MSESYIKSNTRTWYDICVKCRRIVSPRHTSCPKCGGTEFKGTIRTTEGCEQRPFSSGKEKKP